MCQTFFCDLQLLTDFNLTLYISGGDEGIKVYGFSKFTSTLVLEIKFEPVSPLSLLNHHTTHVINVLIINY